MKPEMGSVFLTQAQHPHRKAVVQKVTSHKAMQQHVRLQRGTAKNCNKWPEPDCELTKATRQSTGEVVKDETPRG